MKGQCYCGAIRYEVEPPLKFVAHDHCSVCRRIHGAAFVTWAGVPAAQLRVTAGAQTLKKFKSSPEAERSFCPECGSHLFFQSSRWPGEIHFTVSTITSPIGVLPKAHVFYSNKADWIEVSDTLPKLGGESGTEPL